MNRTLLTALGAALAVAILGWLLRRISTPDESVIRMPGPEDPLPGDEVATVEDHGVRGAEGHDAGDGEPEESVALTSDGWAFVPDGGAVQIVPPEGAEEDLPDAMGRSTSAVVDRNTGALESSPRRRAIRQYKPGEHLDLGDLTGARVVRGSPGADPWRLEALGREGEYRAWPFETKDAARAALELLERRIVQPPLDEDGRPRPPDEEDYAVGFARTQQGISDLAMDLGAEPDPESEPR